MADGKAALSSSNYEHAFSCFTAVKICDPTKTAEVDKLIKLAFEKMAADRKRAKEAEAAAQKAAVEAQNAQFAAEASAAAETRAKVEAIRAQKQADSAFAQAKKLVDAFYFYDNKFALAYGRATKKYYNSFYFIDKQGNRVTKLGEYEKAEQFDDETGFARVKKDEQEYLLDTLGKTYPVAFSPEDLTLNVTALDLRRWKADTFPTQVLAYTQIEVLMMCDNYNLYRKFRILPESISNLKHIKILSLQKCGITSLPIAIGKLHELQELIIWQNSISYLPAEIGQLIELQILDLSSNNIEELPIEIGKLYKLKNLYLGYNQLNKLPHEIGNITQLETLSIQENFISTFPPEMQQLTKLKRLTVSPNQFPPEEIAKLKAWLPNCEIREIPD